jgi:hypothetical protein
VPVYGGPRTVGPAVYPYGQFGQPVPSDHAYSPGYAPSHVLPLSNQNVSAANVVRIPPVQQQLPPGKKFSVESNQTNLSKNIFQLPRAPQLTILFIYNP